MQKTEREDLSPSEEKLGSFIRLGDVLRIINSTPGLLSHQKAQLSKAFLSIEGVEDQKDRVEAREWREIVEGVADKLGIEIKPWPHLSLDELESSLEDEISRLQSFNLRIVVQGVIRALLDVSPSQLSTTELNRVVDELVKEGVDTYSEDGLWSVLPQNPHKNNT